MKAQRGFTAVEVLLALGLGAVVWLLVFRAFTLAVAAQEETQREIAAHQQARATLQWIAGTIQAASEVRGGSAASLELGGTFDVERGAECRGFFLARAGALPALLLYERRQAGCGAGATSEGGDLIVVSDPTVSIARLGFRYLNETAQVVPDPRRARLVEVTIAIDVDRDGRPDYELAQLVGLRAR